MPLPKDLPVQFKTQKAITVFTFIIVTISAFILGIVNTASQDIRSQAVGPTGIPYVCKGDCIYSVGGVGDAATCYHGYCLDPNQDCSFNQNCGWVAGCFGQNQVTCPGYPADTPIPSVTTTPSPTIDLSICTLPNGCNNTCNAEADCLKCSNGNYTCVQKPPTPTSGNSNITATPILTPTLVPLPTFYVSPTPGPEAYQGRSEPCTNEAWNDIIRKYNSNNIGYQEEYMAFLKSCTNICRVPGAQMCTFDPKIPSTSKCPVAPAGNVCAVDKLLPFFDNDVVKATNASRICFRESGGDPYVVNKACTYLTDGTDNDKDGCTDYSDTAENNCRHPYYDGASVDYSVGLFQINLLVSSRCPGAFSGYTWKPPLCSVNNQLILNTCIENFRNPSFNIKFAYQLSQNGTKWSQHWGAAGEKDCNLP